MIKEILDLNPNKKVSGSESVKALQLAVYHCSHVLTNCFNKSIAQSIFPNELKCADIIPVHKKDSTTSKSNYRPISLLPAVSKVFERLIAKQILSFLETRFSKFLCGFRKGYNPQYSLLHMLRKWQSSLNNGGRVGAVLMDLSKAFDTLDHDLLIAKMAAYGFGYHSLKLFQSYLSNRKHRVRIGSFMTEYLEILLGVPQGSVLGPILFNIFINDLLFSVTESGICNFADDNTLYACDSSISDVLERLDYDLKAVVEWFYHNGMVANPGKFQAIFPGAENKIYVDIGPKKIESSNQVKLLGVILDSQLSFYPHVKELCKKASAKTKALRRIRNYLTQDQANRLFDTYIMSSFNYCPLIWMFCSKQAHNLINSTHRRALCAKFNVFSAFLDELLEEYDSISIHSKNLKLLMIEVFKSLNHLSPPIMWETFDVKSSVYNLRQGSTLVVPQVKSSQALSHIDFRATLAWNHLSQKIKSGNLTEFKASIKKQDIYCKCKHCV